MPKPTYDIFISYRRSGGAQYARILQLMLQQRGYTVFLDYDELTDGVFSDSIKAAIKAAPIFMLVLSEKSMERCLNEDDWVRQEVMLAITEKKHIVPVNPDNTFDGFPEDTSDKPFPREIREVIGSHQYSDISFGQTLGITVDFMIEKRIAPVVGLRTHQDHVDTDNDAANESLGKIDAHNRFMKRLGIIGVTLIVLIVLSVAFYLLYHQKKVETEMEIEKQRVALRESLEKTYAYLQLQLNMDISVEQMSAIDDILSKMRPVNADSTFWMSQFECSKGQWYGVMGDTCLASERNMPMTEVSYGEITMRFIDSLNKITHLEFDLPSAEEWEYAAHSGEKNETYLYAGSDDVDAVAWYQGNSGSRVHPSDGQQGKTCNWLDLYDMSGNVCEWCNSPYVTSSGQLLWTVCGGHYNSPAMEVTANSRAGMDTDAKEKTIGFRIVIRKK